jgi:GxxExxY protein
MAEIITIDQITQLAEKIFTDLGAGYSEHIYQTALFNKLIKLDASALKEKCIPVVYENEVLGTCRADILTDTCVIETKATRTMPSSVANQLRKYLVNLHLQDNRPRFGVVINFNQDSERAEFIVLDPIPAAPPAVYKRRKITTAEDEDA